MPLQLTHTITHLLTCYILPPDLPSAFSLPPLPLPSTITLPHGHLSSNGEERARRRFLGRGEVGISLAFNIYTDNAHPL